MSTHEWPPANQVTEAVLRRTPDAWRFAIAGDGTMIDGRLDVSVDVPVEQAKTALIEIIENHAGQVVTVAWAKSPSDPDVWAADIATRQ